MGGNHGAGDTDRVAGFEEERRGADFAEHDPASGLLRPGGGFVQGYTAELAVSAIISSWHRGNAERNRQVEQPTGM